MYVTEIIYAKNIINLYLNKCIFLIYKNVIYIKYYSLFISSFYLHALQCQIIRTQ